MVLDPVEWVEGSLEVRVGAQVVWGPGQANGGPTSGHLQHGLCAAQCFLHSMRACTWPCVRGPCTTGMIYSYAA